MTRNAAGENILCARLAARFEKRGVNNPAVIRKVSLHKANELAKKQAESSGKAAKSKRVTPGFASAKLRIAGREYRRSGYESFEAECHEFIPDGGNFGLAFAKGCRIREKAARFNEAAYERRHPSVVARARAEEEKSKKASRKTLSEAVKEKFSSAFANKADKRAEEGERFVKRSGLPRGVVAAIMLCTVLVLVVVYTYSSYTQVVTDGKRLKEEKMELLAERDHLKNLIELRDDLRDIEDYATNTIGMVKSDLVETRYVSIAGGERIEVIRGEESGESGGFFSNILSAMGSNWDRLLDYIG